MTTTTDNRKSVLITGCSPGGIGNSLAREFHRCGLRVFATARTTQTIEDLNALGIETLSLVVDSEESVKTCFDEISKKVEGKGLDYLVNNAGRNYTMPAMDLDIEETRRLFETNFFAVIHICQTFLPLLMTAQGTIVQIGSIAGLMPYTFGSVYNASKAALLAFSDTLRVELAPFGVKVTTVITGGVKSRITRVDRSLPATSLYQPIDNEYQQRKKHSQVNAMPHEDYARVVVSKILYGPAPWRWLWSTYNTHIWEGHGSSLVKFTAGGWLWYGFFDILFTRMFGLWKLKKTR